MSGSGNAPQRRSSKGRQRPQTPRQIVTPRTGARGVSPAAATRRNEITRLVIGAAAIALVAAVVLIGFNVLGDDDDAANDAVVIPTSAVPAGAGGASPEATSVDDATGSPTSVDEGVAIKPFALGSEDAPVTIVEWADYQCPFCGDFATEVQPQLIEEYVNSGQVRFEFRDYAFLGQESFDAAEAARCAADQDKFWEYHDTLFANQSGENEGAFAEERLIEMARGLGLDVSIFEECVVNNTYAGEVILASEEASRSGIDQTPTFMINDEKVVGIGSYDELRDHIEAALGNQ